MVLVFLIELMFLVFLIELVFLVFLELVFLVLLIELVFLVFLIELVFLFVLIELVFLVVLYESVSLIEKELEITNIFHLIFYCYFLLPWLVVCRHLDGNVKACGFYTAYRLDRINMYKFRIIILYSVRSVGFNVLWVLL